MRIVEIRIPRDIAVFKKRLYPAALYPTPPHIPGAGSVVGQGIFTGINTLFNFTACSLDSIVTQYNVPRCEVPAVLMPIAYITQVNMPTDNVGCSGTTTTIPATGANQTLVEGNNVPPLNQ